MSIPDRTDTEVPEVEVDSPEVDASEGETTEVEQAAAAVDADLAAIVGERDEFRALAQRIQADFENYKKRVQKQQAEMVERAAEALVTQLLPVLDAGELAVLHGGGDEVQQLVGLLRDTLAKAGLEAIAPQGGAPFDPNEHDAVLHEPGEGEPAIGEVMRAGYRLHGRVLRPAMVKVVG